MYLGKTINVRKAKVQVITKEVMHGIKDGVNAIFTSTYEYLPDSLDIYLNGVHLREGGNNYLKIDSSTIRIVSVVLPGDILEASYIRR